MVRVCSGVSACFVSGTSLPCTRARNTSPALMCRSEAPRSTAALMIRSMSSVSCALVDEVSEWLTVRVPVPVVEEQVERPWPESPRRYGRDVRHHERRAKAPQPARGAQRLLGKDVEYGAAQPATLQKVGNRLLVHERAAGDVHHDRALRQPLQPLPGHQP